MDDFERTQPIGDQLRVLAVADLDRLGPLPVGVEARLDQTGAWLRDMLARPIHPPFTHLK